jgi:oligosaccharyltransferase complex subunit epsilon
MAPKKTPSRASTPAASSTSSIHHPSTTTRPTQSSSSSANVLSKNAVDVQQVGQQMWEGYQQRTPQRVKLLDAFLAFLVAVGALQFAYCVIGGNYVSVIFRFHWRLWKSWVKWTEQERD